MKKFIQFIIFTFIGLILNIFQSLADEKIKIGLVVPLSGEYKEVGNSILKSARLAINKIDDLSIEIIPRDSKSNPETTLRVSKELQEITLFGCKNNFKNGKIFLSIFGIFSKYRDF